MAPQERDALVQAYVFLRDVEHKLQMVQDLQTHALPQEEDELERCAIRMGYEGISRSAASRAFRDDHRRHTALVNRVFRSFFNEPNQSALLKAVLRISGRRIAP
jgi:glutamate-ammonia-ligase adenylyltransferase